MSQASDIRHATLETLRDAQATISTARFRLRARRLPEDKAKELGRIRINLEHAILTLEIEELSEIRDQLLENETELLESIDAFEGARKSLSNAKNILETIGGLLGTVGRIVSLLA